MFQQKGRVIRWVRTDGLDALLTGSFKSRTNNGYTAIIKVHFQTKVFLTVKEHGEIFDRLGELMYTDPDELLPQHQHLLMVDLAELGEGSRANKQVWISKMEATRLVKGKVNETGISGGERTEFKEGVSVDGKTRELEEH